MYDDYPKAQMEATSSTGLRVPEPIRTRLKRQRDELQAHLDNMNLALEFLEKNPSFEAFHDTLRKAGL